jgi:hypothetical protein
LVASVQAATDERFEDGLLRLKTLWVSIGDYSGPALVRGRQLDGPGELLFTSSGSDPGPELRFPAGPTGVWAGGYGDGARFLPSLTHVPGPGCYAWQVDSPDFSYTVVFEVMLRDAAASLDR